MLTIKKFLAGAALIGGVAMASLAVAPTPASAMPLGVQQPATAPLAVEPVDWRNDRGRYYDRGYHRGPPPRYYAPPPRVYYAPPPRYYYPPPPRYYAPPPPPRYYAPPPGVGLYFGF